MTQKKTKTPFYTINIIHYDIDDVSEKKLLTFNSFKVTDHVQTTLNLSFSIVDKDEYVYISNDAIISFKLIGSKKHQKDMIELKGEK